MRRRLALLAVLAGAFAVVPALCVVPAADAATAIVRVRPAVAGVVVELHGRRYRSDVRGEVQVPATDAELANQGTLLRERLRVPTTELAPDLRVRFIRWVGRTASVVLMRPVRPTLVDPKGAKIDTHFAPTIVVRGTDGSRVELPSDRVSWLPSTRAVARPGRVWLKRRVTYAVQEVRAHGTNVVHRGKQRFAPERLRHVTIKVLFFSARITVRDALFKSPEGKALVVRFPDGHTERHPLGPRGTQLLEGLPRGSYEVTVEGGGFASSRPIALSKSTDVELRVISWLDVALIAAAVGIPALALAIVRIVHVRRRAPRPGVVSLTGGGTDR